MCFLKKKKKGMMLINTSRGAIINTKDAIEALKRHKLDIWVMCMKVKTLSSLRIYQIQYKDDKIERLMSFNNVLITPHQTFFTKL
jgi:D-lactate dehydrogenase